MHMEATSEPRLRIARAPLRSSYGGPLPTCHSPFHAPHKESRIGVGAHDSCING
jgi:hypothetical protein